VLPTQAHPLTESYSIAGKVFILGEYAVLSGAPALLASVGPRFRMHVSESECEQFHPDSPMGRIQEWAIRQKLPEIGFRFEDPLAGAGGLGASTAQFAMAYLAYAQRSSLDLDRRWESVWNLYRQLMKPRSSTEGMTPSGADLVAQWQGGISYIDFESRRCEELWPFFDWSGFLVFSATGQAGRKVPTHEHLEILSKQGFPHSSQKLLSELHRLVVQGHVAVLDQNRIELGKVLNQYADALQKAGLEVEATRKDRQVLQSLPGVCGVKGMGALQSDGLIVLLNSDGSRSQVIETAQGLGLKLVSDGLTCEMGVSQEK
jgi:mevalonate kinase